MISGLTAYDIVVFTSRHSIAGVLFLRDQRLSDFLNDQRETMVNLEEVTVTRLDEPTRILQKLPSAVIPKSAIVIAFEPQQKAIPAANRLFGYVKKNKTDVFVVMDGVEVQGTLHTQGQPDLYRILTTSPETFLPITQASMTFGRNNPFVITQEAIMVNLQGIRFIGQMPAKEDQESKPAGPAA